MKHIKVSLTIVFCILIFILTSCGTEDSPPSDGRIENSINDITQNDFVTMDIPEDANVIFGSSEYLIYSQILDLSAGEKLLFRRYDISTGNTTDIIEVSYPYMSGKAGIVYDDYLYAVGTISCQETLNVYKINVWSGEHSIVKTLDGQYTYVDFAVTDQLIALLSVEMNDLGETVYQVESINRDNGTDEVVTVERYSESVGNCITCIDAVKDHIYAYMITIDSEKLAYQIIDFNVASGESIVYPLDLSTFFESQGTINNDSILTLKKVGTSFILNSINGRILIINQENGKLATIEIPEDLYRKIPGGYHLLYNSHPGETTCYIVSDTNEPSIYVYDSKHKTVSSISMEKDPNSSYHFLQAFDHKIMVRKDAGDSAQTYYFSCNVSAENCT